MYIYEHNKHKDGEAVTVNRQLTTQSEWQQASKKDAVVKRPTKKYVYCRDTFISQWQATSLRQLYSAVKRSRPKPWTHGGNIYINIYMYVCACMCVRACERAYIHVQRNVYKCMQLISNSLYGGLITTTYIGWRTSPINTTVSIVIEYDEIPKLLTPPSCKPTCTTLPNMAYKFTIRGGYKSIH